MSLLTAADLAGMAATQTSALPDLATIQTPGVTVDPVTKIGTDGYTVRATGVACRLAIDSRQRTTPDAGERLQARLPYIIYLPAGTVIQARDHVVLGARTFEVIAVEDDSWNTILPVRAWEILTHA